MRKLKNEIEEATPLTMEESNKLRVEMASQEARFSEMIKDRNATIEVLQDKINRLEGMTVPDQRPEAPEAPSNTTSISKNSISLQQANLWGSEFRRLRDNGKLHDFREVVQNIRRDRGNGLNQETGEKYLNLGIVRNSYGGYALSDKGQHFAYLLETEA